MIAKAIVHLTRQRLLVIERSDELIEGRGAFVYGERKNAENYQRLDFGPADRNHKINRYPH